MRVKIVILLFILLTTILNASNSVSIGYNGTNIKKFNIDYFLDEENSFSIDTIKEVNFKSSSNYTSFGNIPSTLWIRLNIINTTEIEKEIFLHNDFAYLSKQITIFEFINNKLIDQNIYNILDNKETNKLTGSVLIYPLKIVFIYFAVIFYISS